MLRMAKSKRARKIRQRDEFDVGRLRSAVNPPAHPKLDGTWTLSQALAARDLQMRGQFREPARLARAMRADDALSVGYENRLAPQRAIATMIEPANKNGPARRISAEADALYGPKGIALSAATRADINGDLANHGVAFGVVNAVVRDDGGRIDLHVRHWPIEFVRWSTIDGCYMARTEDGTEERIVHGDGRWIIFSKHETDPWTKDACLLPATLIWASHSTALRDWRKGSTAHGNAKVVGEMPEGVQIQNKDGSLTNEAQVFLELLRAIASLEAPVGIRPAKSSTDYITNNSRAWEVWERLSMTSEKAAARVYLGTDGILGAQGGAPGVDIQALFGVATTKVQGDLGCIERGINTGVIEPWTALNFGNSSLAPAFSYLIPDPDAQQIREEYAKNSTAFYDDIERLKGMFEITQEVVNKLAERYGIDPPTLLPKPEPQPAPETEQDDPDEESESGLGASTEETSDPEPAASAA